MNILPYIYKTEYQWRFLPDEFAPWQTTYHHFHKRKYNTPEVTFKLGLEHSLFNSRISSAVVFDSSNSTCFNMFFNNSCERAIYESTYFYSSDLQPVNDKINVAIAKQNFFILLRIKMVSSSIKINSMQNSH